MSQLPQNLGNTEVGSSNRSKGTVRLSGTFEVSRKSRLLGFGGGGFEFRDARKARSTQSCWNPGEQSESNSRPSKMKISSEEEDRLYHGSRSLALDSTPSTAYGKRVVGKRTRVCIEIKNQASCCMYMLLGVGEHMAEEGLVR